MLSKNGRPLEEFRDSPTKFVRYSMTYEHREDGERLAEQVVHRHLNASKPLNKQLVQIEQVSDVEIQSNRSLVQLTHYQFLSRRCSPTSTFSNASMIQPICSGDTVKNLLTITIILTVLTIPCHS